MASGNDLFTDGFIEIQFTDIQFTHLSTVSNGFDLVHAVIFITTINFRTLNK